RSAAVAVSDAWANSWLCSFRRISSATSSFRTAISFAWRSKNCRMRSSLIGACIGAPPSWCAGGPPCWGRPLLIDPAEDVHGAHDRAAVPHANAAEVPLPERWRYRLRSLDVLRVLLVYLDEPLGAQHLA